MSEPSSLEQRFLFLVRVLELPEPVAEYVFAPPRRFRFDFAWPKFLVAVELDGGTYSGGRHTRGDGYENDCRKNNLAMFGNWSVYHYTRAMLDDMAALALLEVTLRERAKTTL